MILEEVRSLLFLANLQHMVAWTRVQQERKFAEWAADCYDMQIDARKSRATRGGDESEAS